MVEKILLETQANNTNFNKWHIVTNGKQKPLTKPIKPPKKDLNNKEINKNTQNKVKLPGTAAIPKKITVNVNSQKVAALQNKQKENSQPKKKTLQCSLPSVVGNTKAIQQQQIHRRRSNQQEIRQIKRAHRHLLTSGGYDKQQQQQQQPKTNCQKNSCFSTSSSSSLTSPTATSSSALKKTQKLNLSCANNNSNLQEIHNKKLLKTNKTKNSTQNKQHKVKTTNKQKKLKQNSPDQNSLISSRWCSIEERIDLLEKLLYYCDEEQNEALKAWYASIKREYFFDTDSDESSTENGDDIEEPDSLSECDWSWSDIMSSSSAAKAKQQLATHSNEDAQSCISNNSITSSASSSTCSNTSLVPSSLKRRGHQHHPRFAGTRRPNVPPNVQEILDALYKNEESAAAATTTSTSLTQPSQNIVDAVNNETDFMENSSTYTHYTDEPEDDPVTAQRIKASLNLPLTESVTTSMGSNSPTPTDDSSMLDEGVVSAQTPTSAASATSSIVVSNARKSNTSQQPLKEKKSKSKRDKSDKSETNKEKKSKKSKKDKSSSKRSSACLDSTDTLNDAASAATDEGIAIDDDDVQSAEWANLRCTSEAAEIVAEREARRNKNRCADYPGLAFGRSIFSSDTMMKFNIIRNELHNIMNTQLKRVIKRNKFQRKILFYIKTKKSKLILFKYSQTVGRFGILTSFATLSAKL